MHCVSCAVRSIADMAAEPPAEAAYVIDGRSLCGPCALPRLYALANGSPPAGTCRKDRDARMRDARPLFAALSQAHVAAGRPSLRVIVRDAAERCGHQVSLTTVHDVLTGKRVPSYRTVEVLADVFGAEKSQLTGLWKDVF